MVIAYGCANLLQSIAAMRTKPHHSMHPSLLYRLACQRTYLYGVGCQMVGFTLAFFARRELPLFLVQASVAAGLGVMVLLGVATLRWRLPRGELALLALLGFGITSLVISAKPGTAHHITMFGMALLAVALGAIGVLGIFAARLRGVPGSVALGSLAGLAFGAAAVDSRVLAGARNWHAVAAHPLLYLLFAHALLGQLLLGMAMQRGSTTAAVAAMDAASTAPAAVIGLAILGDQIWPGRQWLAAAGFVCTLFAVLGLTWFARPQPGRGAHGHAAVVTATPSVGLGAPALSARGTVRHAVARPDGSGPHGHAAGWTVGPGVTRHNATARGNVMKARQADTAA